MEIPPNIYGQSDYTTSGLYTFVVPHDVYLLAAVCIGGGGGGAGGMKDDYRGGGGGGAGLVYKNKISVIPNTAVTIFVGSGGNGGESYTIGQDGSYSYLYYNGEFQLWANGGMGGKFDDLGYGGDFLCGDNGHVGENGNYGGYFVGLNGGKSAGYVNDGKYEIGPVGSGIGLLGDGAGHRSSKNFGGGGNGGTNNNAGENGGGGAVRIIWGLNRSFPSINTGVL